MNVSKPQSISPESAAERTMYYRWLDAFITNANIMMTRYERDRYTAIIRNSKVPAVWRPDATGRE